MKRTRLRTVICISMLLVIALACCGCRSTKYLPVETVRTDTTYISKEKWDSIYVLDSVFVREKGETLLIEKTKYKYIERVLRDTIYKERTDSVAVPYPVEKQLTWTQRTAIKFFPWLIVACIGLVGWTCRKPLWKLLSWLLT